MAWIRLGFGLVIVGSGCGAESEGARYELAVERRPEEGGTRVWLVDSRSGYERPLSRRPDRPDSDDSQDCFGWAERVGVFVAEGGSLWTYGGGDELREVERPELSRWFLAWDREAIVVPTGEMVLISRVTASSLPGSNPPPGEASLDMVDPLDAISLNLGGAGNFGQLSAGAGPTIAAVRVSYEYVPSDDPWDYGSYESRSVPVMYRGIEEIPVPTGFEGTPTVSPDGARLSWTTNDTVTVTDLEGRVLVSYAGQGISWGNEAFAIRGEDRVHTYDDEGKKLGELEIASAERLEWSPAGRRLLAEFSCGDQTAEFRQQVFEGETELLDTACDHQKFAGWAPDGEAYALAPTRPPDGDRPPPTVILQPIHGDPIPPIEGSFCAFRPQSSQL